MRNEKRMLQEAVDALIDNGRRGRCRHWRQQPRPSRACPICSRASRAASARTCWARVDYPGRSVIVVGPELKIYQCGLPKEMGHRALPPLRDEKACGGRPGQQH